MSIIFERSSETFQLFSAEHFLVVALMAALWALLILVGRRQRGTARLEVLDKVLAVCSLLVVVGANARWLSPARFMPERSFPLDVCDLTAILVPLTLYFRARGLMALLYFWGGAFCSQAVITPDLLSGPLSLDFWAFWIQHGMIIGSAVYMVMVHGFRPAWRDYIQASAAALLYVILVLPIDIAFGFNYGYIGNNRPAHESLIDWLGPWPWRVLVIMALGGIVMGILFAPWEICRRLGARRSGTNAVEKRLET